MPNSKKSTSNNPETSSRLLQNFNKSVLRPSIETSDNFDQVNVDVDVPTDELEKDGEKESNHHENNTSDLDLDSSKERFQ